MPPTSQQQQQEPRRHLDRMRSMDYNRPFVSTTALQPAADWMIRRIPILSDTAAHKLNFVSRYHHGRAVWPVHDLVLNDILVWLLPTHGRTLLIKFSTVLLCFVALIVNVGLEIMNATSETDKRRLLSYLGLLLVLVMGWCIYYRRVLDAIFHCKTWMDPTIPAINRLAMHVPMRFHDNHDKAREAACRPELVAANDDDDDDDDGDDPMDNTMRIQKALTPNVWRLDSDTNHQWDFCLLETAEEGLDLVEQKHQQDTADWVRIPVPSNWTLQGLSDGPIYTNQRYPWPCQPPIVPYKNPTGVYRLVFDMPTHWQLNLTSSTSAPDSATGLCSDYTLLLHGVESACYVYLNHQFVGFSKDTRLPCEFDITPFLRVNHNLLEIVVLRWCDGSYVESQDQWWMAGIHRSVELIRRPAGADILDYVVQADATGHLNCSVDLRAETVINRKRLLRMQLYSDVQLTAEGDWKHGNLLLTREEELSNNQHHASFVADLEAPLLKPWTAETPHLYTLTLSLLEGAIVRQVESCRVGFRTISIRDGVLCVNGKAITVCGINRHEHDPDHGKVVSMDRMKQDICLLKQNNFNLVRNSHYPTHSSFYRLCDFYGLYVWDEANIEVHPMRPMGRLAHDNGWVNTFVSRITRMVHRDRNHASIILWSPGNEAGRGRNFWKARELVQKLDPSRPMCYENGGGLFEGTGRTEITDIVCCMYPDVTRTYRLARRVDEDRPIVFCEYSHAMGNSNGNLHYFWEAFWDKSLPRLQGGCIWDFIDQGLRKKDPRNPGSFYFGYGGDFGDEAVTDYQFCINGMFSPDREPHPAVSEIKFLQQPVSFESGNDSAGDNAVTVTVKADRSASIVLRGTNRYTFIDLAHIIFSWQLISNRSVTSIQSGDFYLENRNGLYDAVLMVDSAVPAVVKLERSSPMGCCKYFLNIVGRLKSNHSWAKAGHVLVHQQFKVDFHFNESISASHADQPSSRKAETELAVLSDEEEVRVHFCHQETTSDIPIITVNKATGTLTSYSPMGRNLFAGATRPNFTRAATDNDRGGLESVLDFILPASHPSLYDLIGLVRGYEEFSYHSHWRRVGLLEASLPRVVCSGILFDRTEDCSRIRIVANCTVVPCHGGPDLFKVALKYKIFNDARVCITCNVVPQPALRKVLSLPRIGLNLQLDASLYHIRYFGRGPEENYPDRKAAAEMGVHSTTPSKMAYLKYIVPGENGSRSDCEWIAFEDNTGDGLLIVSKKEDDSTANFCCSAQLHSNLELDLATHTCDLEPREDGKSPIHVNIDSKLMGVGGDNSWFPVVYPEFQIQPTDEFNFQVWLIPLTKGDDPTVIAFSKASGE